MKYNIILASGSPRRKEILSLVGIDFKVCSSDKEEIITKSKPEDIVSELSYMKAMDICNNIQENGLIVGADTMVAINGQVLGKPKSREDAFYMLELLQGKKHQVYTGVTVILKEDNIELNNYKVKTFVEVSEVVVNPMSKDEIDEYIESGEPFDKAGAYGIQGRFALYVGGIVGDYYNIMGFPIARLYSELKEEGIFLK
jgi:septum formation protein